MENSVSILHPKTAKFIAVGASTDGNCLPCLRYHFAEVVKNGCAVEEIEEAIRISKMVKERPINDIYKLADDLINRAKEGK